MNHDVIGGMPNISERVLDTEPDRTKINESIARRRVPDVTVSRPNLMRYKLSKERKGTLLQR